MNFKKLLAAAVTAAMTAMMLVLPVSAETQTLPSVKPDDGLASGVYELNGDTEVSYVITLAEGADVTIKLNGYTLTSTTTGYIFNVTAGKQLTIDGTDENGTRGKIVKPDNNNIRPNGQGQTLIKNVEMDSPVEVPNGYKLNADFENVTFNNPVTFEVQATFNGSLKNVKFKQNANLSAKGDITLTDCTAEADMIVGGGSANLTNFKGQKLQATGKVNLTVTDGDIGEFYINTTSQELKTITIAGNPTIAKMQINKALIDNTGLPNTDRITLNINGGTYTNTDVEVISNGVADSKIEIIKLLDNENYTLNGNTVVSVGEATDNVTYTFVNNTYNNGDKLPVTSTPVSGSFGKGTQVTLSTSRKQFSESAPEYVFYGWNVNGDTAAYTDYTETITLNEDTTVSPNAPWAFENAKEVTPDGDTYTITTAEELAWVSQQVAEGNTFEGKTILLNNDINLNGKAWYPIGNSSNPFKGTFNGNGKTISNMKCNATHSGFIGHMDGGTVQDLIVSNADVYAVATKEYSAAGCIVGDATNATVLNCKATNSVVKTEDENSFYGGIVGHGVNVTLNDCTVEKLTTEGLWKTGGIIGYLAGGGIADVSVTDSHLKGGTDSESGLIVGHALSTVRIENAVVSGCETYYRNPDGVDTPIDSAIVGTAYFSAPTDTLTIGGNETNITTDIIRNPSPSDSRLIIDGGVYNISDISKLAGTGIAYKETETTGTYNLATVGSRSDLGGFKTVSENGTYDQMYVFDKKLTLTENTVEFAISSTIDKTENTNVTFELGNISATTKIGLIITDIPNTATVTVEIAK